MLRHNTTSDRFRKRRLPMEDARSFLLAAQEVMARLQAEKGYKPTQQDFILSRQIEDLTQHIRLQAIHLHCCFIAREREEDDPPFPT